MALYLIWSCHRLVGGVRGGCVYDDADRRIDQQKAPLRGILLATRVVWCLIVNRKA
jgi:hypothetical protein